jgi:DNA mismatch repair protein MutH
VGASRTGLITWLKVGCASTRQARKSWQNPPVGHPAFRAIWTFAPELRRSVRRQRQRLRAAILLGDAWRIGHHAGRVFALREEAARRKREGLAGDRWIAREALDATC